MQNNGCVILYGKGESIFNRTSTRLVEILGLEKIVTIIHVLGFCYGLYYTDKNVCSGKGSCVANETCYCITGY